MSPNTHSAHQRTPGRSSTGTLRIAILGSSRFGTCEPFAGGLEAHTLWTAQALGRIGHRVTLFAGPADAAQPADVETVPIVAHTPHPGPAARIDVDQTPAAARMMAAGYRRVIEIADDPCRFDVIHNNSLHPIPPALDGYLRVPMIHVLHCPPFVELERAHAVRHARFGSACSDDVIAVSRSLASQWPQLEPSVVPNGVPTDRWVPGSERDVIDRCVWAGRLVEEKAPHLAIDAARAAGLPLVLAGPAHRSSYFDAEIAPRLGADVEWVGHLTQPELQHLYATSRVGLVTPEWEEPFGLVIAEMLACGTPVAAFDRGAVSTVLSPDVGVVARRNTVVGLAEAIVDAARLDRRHCREVALQRLSDTAMVDGYVAHYRSAIARRRRAGTRSPLGRHHLVHEQIDRPVAADVSTQKIPA